MQFLGSISVTAKRSDAESDEPQHSVSYFCQMSFPHIDALFHAVAHIYIDTVICLFLWSADGGKQTGGAVTNRFSFKKLLGNGMLHNLGYKCHI